MIDNKKVINKEHWYNLDDDLMGIVQKLDIEDIKNVLRNTDLWDKCKDLNDYTLRLDLFNHIKNNHEYISFWDYVDEVNYLRTLVKEDK